MRAGARLQADSADSETTWKKKFRLRGVMWQEEGQNNFLCFVIWILRGIYMTETVDPDSMGVFPLFETDYFFGNWKFAQARDFFPP